MRAPAVPAGCGLLAAIVAVGMATGAEEPPLPATPPEVYVVATSHLDDQWRWTIQDTIDDFLPDTLHGNFALFERYPGYTFSFEGAFRYMLIKEYYPEEYKQLKAHIRNGRWKVAGSWITAADTNVPSPESLNRQTLYGNGFFRREFGLSSRDVFLPDCFGFGFALPSVAAHSGLVAFSTQKLTWGSSIKIPFDVGLWEGVDGSSLIAALNPGDYASGINRNLSLDPDVYATADRQVALTGLPLVLKYFGTGDVGVPPLEPSVAWLEQSLAGPGPAHVRSVAPDQMARDLMAGDGGRSPERLQRYRGEFLLTSHGTGCYTSQAAMKRFNRKNERLADDAEKAIVAGWWLGGASYPRERLREAWTRMLWHQFHDDLTGTSIPEAYTFSWNDETIAGTTFADVLGEGVGAVTRALDTRGNGASLVVFNPLAWEREDVVEAEVRFPGGSPPAIRALDPDGREVPAQLNSVAGETAHVAFVARIAPVSFSVFKILPAASAAGGGLKVDSKGLESSRYRVALDAAGDIASVFDKQLGRELLSAPLRLQLLDDEPRRWSAWEVEYDALSSPPREVVRGPAVIQVVENGPARVALEISRQAAGSTFTQRISIAAGDAGDRVEVRSDIDWRTKGTLLKAAFPLGPANQLATYDLGLGVVQRPTNRPNRYEVPAQQWADLTDTTGTFGTTVVTDSRHGWDKPDDHTLRLTLIHTPRVVQSWSWLSDQASNDLGHHRVLVALAGHDGGWWAGRAPLLGDRVNQPLLAWQSPVHAGPLGRSFSLLRLVDQASGGPTVAVRALKLAEESDEVVVRLQELSGRPVQARLAFAGPVATVREVNGAEEPLAEHGTGGALPPPPLPPPALEDGIVLLDFAPFRPRTLAITLGQPPAALSPPSATPLDLPYDLDGVSRDEARTDGDFDGEGHTVAGELLPPVVLASNGVTFRTGPQEPGRANVVACRGQRLTLPAGDFNRLYLIAASIGGDRLATFTADRIPTTLLVPDWAEPTGQWNDRLVAGDRMDDADRIAPAYAKTVPVAWIGSHRHDARGENEAYVFTHFFRLRLDLRPGARTLTLPNDERIRVLAATAARNDNDAVVAAQPFTDPAVGTVVHVSAPGPLFLDRTTVTLMSPNPGATIRYTLDGNEPTATSPAYVRPLRLEATTTVRARAFAPGLDDSFVATATFTRTSAREPATVSAEELAPGLACRTYEGDWRTLPDFTVLEPTGAVTIPTVSLPTDRSTDRLGMVCEGYLSVPADDLYTFWLRSADGSQLLLDGERVVRNEAGDFVSRRGRIALKAGLHELELHYVHRSYVAGLELSIESADRARTPIGAHHLYHRAESVQPGKQL